MGREGIWGLHGTPASRLRLFQIWPAVPPFRGLGDNNGRGFEAPSGKWGHCERSLPSSLGSPGAGTCMQWRSSQDLPGAGASLQNSRGRPSRKAPRPGGLPLTPHRLHALLSTPAVHFVSGRGGVMRPNLHTAAECCSQLTSDHRPTAPTPPWCPGALGLPPSGSLQAPDRSWVSFCFSAPRTSLTL